MNSSKHWPNMTSWDLLARAKISCLTDIVTITHWSAAWSVGAGGLACFCGVASSDFTTSTRNTRLFCHRCIMFPCLMRAVAWFVFACTLRISFEITCTIAGISHGCWALTGWRVARPFFGCTSSLPNSVLASSRTASLWFAEYDGRSVHVLFLSPREVA